MDIGLAEDENHMKFLTRNDEVQENSAWTQVKFNGELFLALKLRTSNHPHDFRYYGFHWIRMTRDGHGGYLCQHSRPDEENPNHTVDTYMEKFMRKEFMGEQTYHITLVHKEDSISGRLFSEGLVA